jgi:hypothetical protein
LTRCKFADIESIKVAQDREKRLPALWESKDRAAEVRATTEVMAANDIAAFQTEYVSLGLAEIVLLLARAARHVCPF